MKIYLVILLMALTSCNMLTPKQKPGSATYTDQEKEVTFTQPEGSKTTSSFEIDLTEGEVKATFGKQHDNFGKMAAFKNFRIYHIAAVILICVGVWILGSGHVVNRWGYTSIATGAGLGIFAHFVPSNGPLISFLLIAGVIGGLVYLLWNYIPKSKKEEG